MEGKGFDFSKYSNPLASIHTVLQRLVKSGKVKVVPQKAGKKAYQWITVIDGLLAILQTMGTKGAAQSALKESGPHGSSDQTAKRLGVALPKR